MSFLSTYRLHPTDHLIVGCSGGPDSMYLVEQLRMTKHPITIAHVNHMGFRDGSETDADFVAGYCDRHELTYEQLDIDVTEIKNRYKTSIENACRIERKKFFEALQKKYGATYIVLAHHLDDQIETMIYRMLRWTKLLGLTGMQPTQWDYLRPLLHMPKSEILTWLENKKIPYVIDPSNMDDVYMRNHIRQNITPHFEKINPEYRNNMQALHNYFTEMNDWITSQFSDILEKKSFHKKYYLELPGFLQSELIRVIYQHTNNGTIGLSEANIAEVDRYIRWEHGNKKKKIHGLDLYKKGGVITWLE